MKNRILLGAFFSLVGAQADADITQQVTPPPLAINNAANTSDANKITPTQPAQITTPVINCDYKIPAQIKKIDQSLVLQWSEKATTQAFDFNPDTIDSQMQKLQACFTEQGWAGFNTALQKSGNLEAIKSQKLNVSSQVEGQSSMMEAKDNKWKITIPLQVVYQNDKEKVTQLLSVDLTVTRKPNGDLGIIQMIASPRGTVTLEKTKAPAQPGLSNNPPNQQAPAPGTTKAQP